MMSVSGGQEVGQEVGHGNKIKHTNQFCVNTFLRIISQMPRFYSVQTWR